MLTLARLALIGLMLAPIPAVTAGPALAAASENAFCAKREQSPAGPVDAAQPPSAEENAARKRQAFAERLRDHYCWYAESKWIHGTLWIVGTLSVTLLTAVTAYLVAIDFGTRSARHRMVLAALPATAALVTALLGQFRVQEIWELRESGRIDTYALIDRLRLVRANDGRSMDAALAPLRQHLLEIEAAQAGRFFSSISGKQNGGPAPPDPAILEGGSTAGAPPAHPPEQAPSPGG